MYGLRARWAKHIAEVAIEVLNMRLAAQLEFVLAKTQCVQQYPVIEYFRARQIGSRDVDVMIAITSVMVLVRLMQNGRSA